jgi:phosphonate utilization transcriptional regulator
MAELQTPGSQISFLIKRTLPQLVQMELERLILTGELHAGERLNEVAIAERLNVSRGPVREALRTLEEAGLVRFEKNRGATVRVVSPEEAVDIYEIRATLEELACRRLAGRITEGQLAQLRPLVDQMQPAAEAGDAAAFNPLNMRFHELLVEFSGNGELVVIYRRLVSNLSLFRRRTLALEGSLLESNAEHRRIVELLGTHDAAAGALMREHIDSSSRRTEMAFRADAAQQDSAKLRA